LSGYFINNLFTTVGFGDIAGTNTAERLFCIFTMWSGTIIFAVVVSETSDIVAKFGEKSTARKERLQEIRRFLQQNNISKHLQEEILDWSHFRIMFDQKQFLKDETFEVLPAPIQQKLSLELDQGLIGSLPVFDLIQDIELKEKLISVVSMQSTPCLAAAGQQIEVDENSEILIIRQGRVVLFEESRHGDFNMTRELHPGEHVGRIYAIDRSPKYIKLIVADHSPCEFLLINKNSLEKALSFFNRDVKQILRSNLLLTRLLLAIPLSPPALLPLALFPCFAGISSGLAGPSRARCLTPWGR